MSIIFHIISKTQGREAFYLLFSFPEIKIKENEVHLTFLFGNRIIQLRILGSTVLPFLKLILFHIYNWFSFEMFFIFMLFTRKL
jgi:hypothetical protein